jgi:hypothetical protein
MASAAAAPDISAMPDPSTWMDPTASAPAPASTSPDISSMPDPATLFKQRVGRDPQGPAEVQNFMAQPNSFPDRSTQTANPDWTAGDYGTVLKGLGVGAWNNTFGGAAALTGGFLAHVGALLATQDPDAAKAVRDAVESSFTIDPTSESGRRATQGPTKMLQGAFQAANGPEALAAVDKAARATFGDDFTEYAKSGLQMAGEAAMALPGAEGLARAGARGPALELNPKVPTGTEYDENGMAKTATPPQAQNAPPETGGKPVTGEDLKAQPDPLAPAAAPAEEAAPAPAVERRQAAQGTPPGGIPDRRQTVQDALQAKAADIRANPPTTEDLRLETPGAPRPDVMPPPREVPPPAAPGEPGSLESVPMAATTPAPAGAPPAAAEPAPVRFTAPAAEGSQSGAVPAADQQTRLDALNKLDQMTNGALGEVRTSAITGDYADTSVDANHAKINDAGGKRMQAVIGNEQDALKKGAGQIASNVGDSASGVDQHAMEERGGILDSTVGKISDWFDNAIHGTYEDAKTVAKGQPITQLPRFSDYINNQGHEWQSSLAGAPLIEKGVIPLAKKLGLMGDNGTFHPATVEQAETMRKFLGSKWNHETAPIIGKLRDALDTDVAEAGGEKTFKDARALRARKAALLENPTGIAKLLDNRSGINRDVPIGAIPDYIANLPTEQFNHVVNVLRSAAHLGNGELAEDAAGAIRALKGHMADRLADAGGGKGAWSPQNFYKQLNKYSTKMPAVFDSTEMGHYKTLNDASNMLRMDNRYPGAGAQTYNTGVAAGIREQLGKGAHATVDLAAHHVAPVLGPIVAEGSGVAAKIGKLVGGNPEKAAERARLKDVEGRITQLGGEQPPPTPGPGGGAPEVTPLGQSLAGARQRGGPKAETGNPYNSGAKVVDAWGNERTVPNRLAEENARAQAEGRKPSTLGEAIQGGRQRGGPKAEPAPAEPRGGNPYEKGQLPDIWGRVPVKQDRTPAPLGQIIGGARQRGGPKMEPEAPGEEPAARVNIGLHVGDPANGGRVMAPEEAIQAMKDAGANVGKTSVVNSNTEPTLVADVDKPFAPKDLHALSSKLEQGAIAQRNADGTGILAGPQAKDWGGKYNPDFFREHNGNTATENHPVFSHLTDQERAQLRTDTSKRLVDAFHSAPATEEYAAAALGGKAKKGWYRDSAKAIANVFGADAPRFSALLAAMSPQTSVQMNFHNALRSFINWDKAGRPQDPAAITKILSDSSLKGPETPGTGNVLGAWINNSVRALTSENPDKLTLSGPKVHSFYQNLHDNVNEVTNDAWMAAFAKIDPAKLGGALNKAGPGKSPTYMALSAKVRAAAKMLTHMTGDSWTPREVQETVWSWAKTAYEHAEQGDMTIPELVKHGKLTDELIRSTPDFHQLFSSPEHRGFIADSRYARNAEQLASRQGEGANAAGPSKKSAAAEKSLRPSLISAANRLESLRQERGRNAMMGNAASATDEDEVPF